MGLQQAIPTAVPRSQACVYQGPMCTWATAGQGAQPPSSTFWLAWWSQHHQGASGRNQEAQPHPALILGRREGQVHGSGGILYSSSMLSACHVPGRAGHWEGESGHKALPAHGEVLCVMKGAQAAEHATKNTPHLPLPILQGPAELGPWWAVSAPGTQHGFSSHPRCLSYQACLLPTIDKASQSKQVLGQRWQELGWGRGGEGEREARGWGRGRRPGATACMAGVYFCHQPRPPAFRLWRGGGGGRGSLGSREVRGEPCTPPHRAAPSWAPTLLHSLQLRCRGLSPRGHCANHKPLYRAWAPPPPRPGFPSRSVGCCSSSCKLAVLARPGGGEGLEARRTTQAWSSPKRGTRPCLPPEACSEPRQEIIPG